MGSIVLVTEGDSELGAALVRLLLSREYAVASMVERDHTAADAAKGKPFLSLKWNRRSPASARAVLLSALNSFGALDEALILEPLPPPSFHAGVHQIASAVVEKSYDDAKGPVFMAREILSYFLDRKPVDLSRNTLKGVLSLVSYSPPREDAARAEVPPMVLGTREGFRGFVSSILSHYPRSGVIVNGYQSDGAGPEEFAQFIIRTLDEKGRKIAGRWFTCQPKAGFLQGMLSTSARRG